jgi:hypothetical protein
MSVAAPILTPLQAQIQQLMRLISDNYIISMHVVQGITYIVAVPKNHVITSSHKCFICTNMVDRDNLGPWEGLYEIPNFLTASKEFSLDDIELAEKIMSEL